MLDSSARARLFIQIDIHNRSQIDSSFPLSPPLRCNDPSLYSDPEDMITVAHLYCVSLAFRLAIGGDSMAIASGLVLLFSQQDLRWSM